MKTKDLILAVGVEIWADKHKSPTIRQIADEIGFTHPAILYHFSNSSREMRHQLAQHAVTINKASVIRMLIAEEHPTIKDMSSAQRLSFFDGTAQIS